MAEFLTSTYIYIFISLFFISSAIIALVHEYEFTKYIKNNCKYLRDPNKSIMEDTNCDRGNDRGTTWNSKIISYTNFAITGIILIISILKQSAFDSGDATENNEGDN